MQSLLSDPTPIRRPTRRLHASTARTGVQSHQSCPCQRQTAMPYGPLRRSDMVLVWSLVRPPSACNFRTSLIACSWWRPGGSTTGASKRWWSQLDGRELGAAARGRQRWWWGALQKQLRMGLQKRRQDPTRMPGSDTSWLVALCPVSWGAVGNMLRLGLNSSVRPDWAVANCSSHAEVFGAIVFLPATAVLTYLPKASCTDISCTIDDQSASEVWRHLAGALRQTPMTFDGFGR